MLLVLLVQKTCYSDRLKTELYYRALCTTMHNMQNLMTPAEVADELRISLRKVYLMVDSGHLDAIRIGKKTLRIPRSSVDAVLSAPAQ